jgi:hypothetical protein
VINILERSVALHGRISNEGVELKDNTDSYQKPWRDALVRLTEEGKDDFGMLELLR